MFSDILMEEDETPTAAMMGGRGLPAAQSDPAGGGSSSSNSGRRERRANRPAAHLQHREREFTGISSNPATATPIVSFSF
jgi:hypothetical protein